MKRWISVCIAAWAAFGQSSNTPAFEAASVKVSTSNAPRGRMRGGPGTSDVGQITFTNVTLAAVLLRAYDINTFQLTAPDWISTRRYDIAAKIPPGATEEQFNAMLRNLLAERFHLVLHHETKNLQGYELVTGRSGPKLKASANTSPAQIDASVQPKIDANGFPQFDGPGLLMMEGVKGKAVVTFLTAQAQPISALVERLTKDFQLPILDKTGLTGKFDFKLQFAPQAPGALPRSPAMDGQMEAADDSAPNLTTAVQQMGLRLNSAKVPTDVIVIDRADQVPVEN